MYLSSIVPTWQCKKYPDNVRKIKQVQPGYNIIQGTNKLCCYKRVSLYVKCKLKVKEKYFKTKRRPAGILLNINIMIYLKFKLQLKYRKKNFPSIIVNFHTTQYINGKLKFRTDKGYHVKRPGHWDIVASLLLIPLKQCLIDITSFRLSKSHYS